MSEQVKYSDLYESDLVAKLKELQKANEGVLQSQLAVLKVAKESPKNSENITKATQAIQQAETAQKSFAETQKKINTLTNQEVEEKIKLQRATKAQKDEIRDEIILRDKNSGTLERNAARSRQLRREREKLNLDTAKGRKRLQEINAELDKNNKKLISNSDQLKKQRLNVGNYTNSIKDAASQSGLFSTQIAALQRIQATLGVLLKKNTAETTANAAAQKAAGKASGGFSKALRILKVALISTGIGAIVVALGSLIAAFSSTQRGADAFSKALRPIQAIFQRIIGFLQDTGFKIFDRLKAAFEDPKQAVIDLADAIKRNLINRFNSLAIFGSAIAKLFKGEFKEGFSELGDAALQLATGVENAGEKLREAAKDVSDFVDESVKQGERLDELIKTFERREIDTVVPLAQARLEFQRLRAIAQDLTKTDQERIDALVAAEKQQRFIAQTEKELLDLTIDKIKLEQSFNDTSREEELELQRLLAQRLQAEEAAQKKINSLISLRTGIEKRAETLRQKALSDEEKRAQQTQDLLDTLDIRFTQGEFDQAILQRTRKFEQELQKIDNNANLSLIQRQEIQKKLVQELQDDITEIEKKAAEQRANEQVTELNKELKEFELALLKSGKKQETIQEALRLKRIQNLQEEIEIRKKLGQDTVDLEIQLEKEKNKTLASLNKDASKERLDQFQKDFNSLSDIVNEETKKLFEQQSADINREIQDREANIAAQRARANAGLENQLAFEQQKRDEALLAQRQLEEKQRRIEQAIRLSRAFVETYIARLKQNETPAQAKTGAFGDVLSIKAISENLPSNYYGTEDTGAGGDIDNKGGFLAIQHPHERVVTAKQNKLIGNISNPDLAKMAYSYRMGDLIPKNTSTTDNSMVVYKLDQVYQAITNIPHQSFDMNKFGNWVETVQRGAVKQVITHKIGKRI